MKTMNEALVKLLNDPDVQKALVFIKEDETNTLKQQIDLAETAAPPFAEKTRAIYYQKLLQEAGLKAPQFDEIANVFGNFSENEGSKLLVSAYLDSVFSENVDVSVTEKSGIYYGAGICDDARGLATILSVIRALTYAKIELDGTLMFAGDVGEESQGDLRGIKKIFQDNTDIDGYISVDGSDPTEIIYQGTGSIRYIFTFKAVGGHSFGDFGRPSAIHAAVRAAAKIVELEVPQEPKTTFNVGVIEGGTLPTAIAENCQMKVDIRSNSAEKLAELNALVIELVEQAVVAENARTENQANHVQLEIELIGNRPAGTQEETAIIVQSANHVIKSLNLKPKLIGASSTNANVPISLGIPAITIGGGGQSGNAHSLSEWYNPQDSYIGVQQVFLLILLLLGVKGKTKGTLK